MWAVYRLIASEVTHVNRNGMCACACVRVHVREWTGVRRLMRRKLYNNAKLLLYI